MNPAMIIMIAKTLFFKDVTEDVKAQGKDSKPAWLSRRYLHSGLTSIIGLAAVLGVSIPADQATILVDSVSQIIEVVQQNAGLWPAIVTSAGAIWGAIRAGKSGGKMKK